MEGDGCWGMKEKKNSMSKTILSPRADPIEKSPRLGRAAVVKSGYGQERAPSGLNWHQVWASPGR